MKGRVLALALLLASLSATAVPAAAPMLRAGSPLDACSMDLPVPLAGFSPLGVSAGTNPETSPYSCYQLYVRPGFPFRGTITVTLSDGFRTASLSQHCDFSGVDSLVPGVLGCGGLSGSAPPLTPGPMTLRCSVSDAVVSVGSWECGATFGNGA